MGRITCRTSGLTDALVAGKLARILTIQLARYLGKVQTAGDDHSGNPIADERGPVARPGQTASKAVSARGRTRIPLNTRAPSQPAHSR